MLPPVGEPRSWCPYRTEFVTTFRESFTRKCGVQWVNEHFSLPSPPDGQIRPGTGIQLRPSPRETWRPSAANPEAVGDDEPILPDSTRKRHQPAGRRRFA